MSAPRAPEPVLDIEPVTRTHGWLLRAEQWVPVPRADVFPFFQDPQNLERITPAFLRFRVRRASTTQITEGTRIWYRLSLHGVPIFWRTRIGKWNPPFLFEDVQERGPYRLWQHRHEFEEQDGGTLVRDIVHFELWLARLVPAPVEKGVVRDVRAIFEYRQRVIAATFSGS